MNVDEAREGAQAENTRIAYEKGWRCFARWCRGRDLPPDDAAASDVAAFMVAMWEEGPSGRPLALSTLQLYRSALVDRWRRRGAGPSPASDRTVDEVLRGLARKRNDPPRQAKAIREGQLLAMLETCADGGLHALRDAAVLSLGFSVALRRSELCALRIDDLEPHDSGLRILIRRSKTDKLGRGQAVAVIDGAAIRPITRLNRWLEASGIASGFAFQSLARGGKPSGAPLHPGEVSRIVKRRVAKLGFDPRPYSGHSLRAGFVTSAAAHHARIDKIMEVTRHRRADTVLRYIRDEESFVDHAGASFL